MEWWTIPEDTSVGTEFILSLASNMLVLPAIGLCHQIKYEFSEFKRSGCSPAGSDGSNS
jgi:hypothetical protein